MAKTKNSKASKKPAAAGFQRVATGIPGLDTILNGGFLTGGTYLILGEPGTGKTILSNQFSYHQIRNGGKVLYVTLLAENHGRMFGNLREFSFFDQDDISNSLQYVSGYRVLEESGLDGLLRLLNELVIRYDARMLFIDGVASADAIAGSPHSFKKFVHALNTVLGITGCTTFLLSSAGTDTNAPEHTMVDGILRLTLSPQGMRNLREIEVRKFRGSNHLQGRHCYEITGDGISVYPRIEALYGQDSDREGKSSRELLPSGVSGLDELIGGGIVRGTVTSLTGTVGAGKTTMGVNFLEAGYRSGQTGLLASLYEDASQLVERFAKAPSVLKKAVTEGKIHIKRLPPGDFQADRFLAEILNAVREEKVERIFVDGVIGLRDKVPYANRFTQMMTVFTRELRAAGVTAVFTEEINIDAAPRFEPLSNHSGFGDNLIETRHVNLAGRRLACLAVLKTRRTAHDPIAHLVEIQNGQVKLGPPVLYEVPGLPSAEIAETVPNISPPKSKKS